MFLESDRKNNGVEHCVKQNVTGKFVRYFEVCVLVLLYIPENDDFMPLQLTYLYMIYLLRDFVSLLQKKTFRLLRFCSEQTVRLKISTEHSCYLGYGNSYYLSSNVGVCFGAKSERFLRHGIAPYLIGRANGDFKGFPSGRSYEHQHIFCALLRCSLDFKRNNNQLNKFDNGRRILSLSYQLDLEVYESYSQTYKSIKSCFLSTETSTVNKFLLLKTSSQRFVPYFNLISKTMLRSRRTSFCMSVSSSVCK